MQLIFSFPCNSFSLHVLLFPGLISDHCAGQLKQRTVSCWERDGYLLSTYQRWPLNWLTRAVYIELNRPMSSELQRSSVNAIAIPQNSCSIRRLLRNLLEGVAESRIEKQYFKYFLLTLNLLHCCSCILGIGDSDLILDSWITLNQRKTIGIAVI